VTAPAGTCARPGPVRPGSSFHFLAIRAAAIGACCVCWAGPAAAEVGATLSLFSDARFRGYSLSEGHPVGNLDLSYDGSNGLYAAVSASALASSHEGIKPLGLQLNAGYAKRLSDITLDVGAVHSAYSHYSSAGSANSYTEVYAGLTYKVFSSRIAFSPHYFAHGAKTLYGEINANVSPVPKVYVTGHAGLLVPLSYRDNNAQYDWRIGISREIGRASIHLIGSGGGPGRDRYHGREHSRNALVVGVSWAL
jgi:uncharacterized protein (TIGR02001 family)